MRFSFIYPHYLWLLLGLPLIIGLAVWGKRRRNQKKQWGAVVVRCIILIALVFALAGVQLKLQTDALTTVFVLDRSDSLTPSQHARGEDFIRKAISEKKGNHQAAIIVFGAHPLIERLSNDLASMQHIASVPDPSRTDISSALQLAQAILPGEGARRIVLLSDGRENMGKAIEQAEFAAASQIELSYVPLGDESRQNEVYFESLKSPVEIRIGQDFNLNASIYSSVITEAELRIFEDNRLIQSTNVRLLPGTNQIQIVRKNSSISGTQQPDGNFLRFHAQIIADNDTLLQNNEASAFTIVHGPPGVLIVEAGEQDGRNIEEALLAAEMRVDRVLPQAMPTTLDQLADYDGLILVGVPASSLPPGTMETLQVYVRDLGKGLLMIGGEESFGAGGYLRTPLERSLPVDMDVRDKEIQSNLALILAVDKSGSMDRCHCDNPDLNQSYTPQLTGQAKIDIAKEAVMRAAGALGEQDYLGVLAFDSQPRWAVELSLLPDVVNLENAISVIRAEGQTNMQASVYAAYEALQKVSARRKHIILMTDGWIHAGELNNLVQQMRQNGITLSIVAAGEGSAEYLSALATLGGGEYYPAENIQAVPDIFLKEAIQSVGEYVIEEPFFPIPSAPSPVLRGLDPMDLPPLLGYNGTSAKKTARLDLITPRGDPLLASWQYGLGRSAVWTSDLRGKWASAWLEWEGFPRFVSQLVGWILPSPQVEGISVETELQENKAVIHVYARQPDGSPHNFLNGTVTLIDPKLKASQIELKQTSPGEYEASTTVSIPGVYLARVGINHGVQTLGQSTVGLVVPYSPEYKSTGIDYGLLHQLASITGGRQILNESESFSQTLLSIPSTREIWQTLLILAVLLFPMDVAARRLSIRKKDLQLAAAWIKSKRTQSAEIQLPSGPKLLDGLFEARQRARSRLNNSRANKQSADWVKSEQTDLTPSVPVNQAPKNLIQDVNEGKEIDPLARLRDAKKRARRQ